jgi:hypothetical protein
VYFLYIEFKDDAAAAAAAGLNFLHFHWKADMDELRLKRFE